MKDRKFYVIGVYGPPWVLTDEGLPTYAKAEAAIRWQGGQASDWVIARRTGPDTFVHHDAPERTFTAGQGPYTTEAFDRFKAEWTS